MTTQRDHPSTDSSTDRGSSGTLGPLFAFITSVVAFIFRRLKVVVAFGVGGFLAGVIIGVLTGPFLPFVAAIGGAIGLLIGAYWEFVRVQREQDYEDLFGE